MMKLKSLTSANSILLLNWIVIPILFIWIFIECSFIFSIIFIVLWVLVDKIWDWISGILILKVGEIGSEKIDTHEMEMSGEVPLKMGIMMILDLVITLTIPWIITVIFLTWLK